MSWTRSVQPNSSSSHKSSNLYIKKQNNNTSSIEFLPFYFLESRYNITDNDKDINNNKSNTIINWRIKNRMKTSHAILVLALNIGVDPPNSIKISPCARTECWIDPKAKIANDSLKLIGRALQIQYERWQPRARYKQCLDPTINEIKKTCISMRRNAKKDRVLFHYNGRGVPNPTNNSEIWVFNKDFTQYIPLALYDLNNWLSDPCIYVFDCCSADILIQWFKEKYNSDLSKNIITLGACRTSEILPTNPNLPADIFTACLTTPIRMALHWFCSRTSLTGIDLSLIHNIPGTVNDRRTLLGELNWIFTTITDTIAWNVLPHDVFQKLFRQDLLVASLMRNYLLAERILKSFDCTPISYPSLPSTYQHSLWKSWDLVADSCISQLPKVIKNPKYFIPSSFFNDQLVSFEIWLKFASEKYHKPPEQLPILLQVLLSKQHRFKALELLSEFLNLGEWAVNHALSVGIFPYLLKLLQNPPSQVRKLLVCIWARILAVDQSCQADLLKDSGHSYFCNILSTQNIDIEQRTKAAFVLTVIMKNFRQGQAACLSQGLLNTCLSLLSDSNSLIRYWCLLCLAMLWKDYNEAKYVAIREKAYEKLCLLLTDSVSEVRTASIYALGTFIGGAGDDENRLQIEKNIGLTLFIVTADMSPMARRELIISLTRLIFERTKAFLSVVMDMTKEEVQILAEREARKKDKKRNHINSKDTASSSKYNKSSLQGSVLVNIWKIMLTMRNDPHPLCSSLAKKIVRIVYSKLASQLSVNIDLNPQYTPILSHVLRKTIDKTNTPTLSRKKTPLLSLRRESRRSANNILQVAVSESQSNESKFDIHSFPSNFYTWSFKNFIKPKEILLDHTSPIIMERDWRLRQQSKLYNNIQAIKNTSMRRKFDSQIALMNDSDIDLVSLIQLHPTEPLCFVTDDKHTISVWNWEDSTKLQSFSNKNIPSSCISSMSLVNTQDQAMIMVGSNDGVIRLWKDVYGDNNIPSLVTAWRALSDITHLTQRSRGSGLIFDWNQANGKLMTSGDAPIIRVWDVEKELSIEDISTGTESTCITKLRHQPTIHSDSIIITGCGDGSIRIFDIRISQKNGVTSILNSHKGWILDAVIPSGNTNTIVSGDVSGEVKYWDLRSTNRPRVSYGVHKGDMTSFAVHEYAEIFCTGTQNQKIRLASGKDGKELNSIRYHDGLILGQRIGPVSSLAFHPYKLVLAAGATDSIISMYKNSASQ